EAGICLERGVDGIGLYRTEFLYLTSQADPTEDDHYQAYAEVIRAMEGRPVVIRTLDLGADKMGLSPDPEAERNPFLGLRSIRLALRNLNLFVPQLRAVLRASVLGDVQVMFPLITTIPELRQAKQVLADAMQALRDEGVEFNEQIPVGMMVESPSAAILIDQFLAEVDFISIGTNDLVQYTLAVDRTNSAVADLYQDTDPAVLQLINRTLSAATAANVPASLCGQMSAEPVHVPLLLGMGLRSLSVPPSIAFEIKRVCRSVSITHCKEIAKHALSLASAREIELYLTEEFQKLPL
ncbi:MAG: phosphoenolpyruvate--protein phosphotransferase, partial [Planctomycetes bacterium]|nr:phosphoenolpyruvate--protein phosphotransferase [Planctomycetota bacterium]